MYESSTHDSPESDRPIISILTDLEHAIRADPPKTPTESGRVHPLTRLVMDQLHHACLQMGPTEPNKLDEENDRVLAMVSSVMDLLDSNLESRSRLYKDQALGYVFMMNNRRYILQQVKDSEGMKALMEDTWCRKRSSDLRLYHKEYQRETWGRLLGCLNPDGLTSPANGKPVKPILKERLKSFNSMFDEIHKTQSNWVVSDEQLQSELRVAISNMVVPAYRSFLGRFGQVFKPGRQTHKYVKYQAEDIEEYIEDLFCGHEGKKKSKKKDGTKDGAEVV